MKNEIQASHLRITRARLCILPLAVVLLLCLSAAGCKLKTSDPAPTERQTEAATAAPVVLPETAPDTDALFSAAAGAVFSLPFRSGNLSLETGAPFADSAALYTPLFSIPNRVMSLHAEAGYRLHVLSWDTSGKRERLPVMGEAVWYAQKNARWAFVLERTDGGEIGEAEAAMVTVTLLDPDAVEPSAHGLWTLSPVWGTEYSYGGSFALQPGALLSAPLPLSDGGLGVLFGGDDTIAARAFRVAVVRFTDDGLAPAEDAVLQALSNADEFPAQSLYLPQAADCYAVLILRAGSDPGLLTLSGGSVAAEENTRLKGLFNMNIRLDEGQAGPILQMIQYRADKTVPNQDYLGAILRASDVERITCDPRYELTATLWAPDATGTLKRTKTYWNGVQPGGEAPRGSVSLAPDAGDEGFLLLCVHRRAEPLFTSAGTLAVKSRGMGAMRGYEEVSAGVVVDYAPGRASQIQVLDNPIITQNALDLSAQTVPYVYSSAYSTPQKPDIVYMLTEMTDVSPVIYNGKFDANTYLHHVTPRSYLTAAANPNSRYYLYSNSKGYGSTCVNFALSLLGITEEYSISQIWKEDLLKFDRTPFSVATDFETLLPGDLLLEIDPVSREGHAMIVKELLRNADGSLYAVSIMEAWPPFSRQRTFYLTGAAKADSTLLTACLPSALDDYVCRLRIRPEYLRLLRETYDMAPDLTTGTVMCDRGTDAVYCMGANLAEFSVSDEAAKKIRLYRDGKFAGELSLSGATRRNGLRVVSFAHLLTAPGLYTVTTDLSDDVQEQFYVPEKMPAFHIERTAADPAGGEERITITAALSALESVKVYYRREKQAGTDDARPEYGAIVYPAEALAPVVNGKYGEGWGTLTVPTKWEDMHYEMTHVVYRTPYGTVWLGYLNKQLVQRAE